MTWVFFFVCSFGVLMYLIFAQGVSAWGDHRLTHAQMTKHCILAGYSIMDHGGMYADLLVVSPVSAYIFATYSFAWNYINLITVGGLMTIAIAIAKRLDRFYSRQSTKRKDSGTGTEWGEAHNHGGETTFAGRLHGIFGCIVVLMLLPACLGLTTVPVSKFDLDLISMALISICVVGPIKFHPHWWRQFRTDRWAHLQIFGGTIVVIILRAVRWYFSDLAM